MKLPLKGRPRNKKEVVYCVIFGGVPGFFGTFFVHIYSDWHVQLVIVMTCGWRWGRLWLSTRWGKASYQISLRLQRALERASTFNIGFFFLKCLSFSFSPSLRRSVRSSTGEIWRLNVWRSQNSTTTRHVLNWEGSCTFCWINSNSRLSFCDVISALS